MTTEVKKRSSTSVSMARQGRDATVEVLRTSTQTSTRSLDDLIMVPGQYVGGDLSFSVAPASVKRKLEVRRLNVQVEGRTLPSNTALKLRKE